jgi:ribosomal protein S18 acetylase RimI-like enzyme
MILVKRVTDLIELEGIRKLQEENLKRNISEWEAEQQGFVTAEYSMKFLNQMHDAGPSIIAKDGEAVVGYALVAEKSIRHFHPLLADLFNTIDKTHYRNELLKDTDYVVVGQLCVHRKYRGQGLVPSMYDYFKDSLENEFDCCITDVASNNPRSLKAHLKCGFQVIDTLKYGGLSWDIVLWNWRG